MHTFKGLIVVAALAVSTSAAAAPGRLTDVQYMQAARCRALIASPALGGGDTAGIDQVLKSQGRGRVDFVYDRAQEMERAASRSAASAGVGSRATLIAERDGPCQAFTGAPTTDLTAASHPASSN